MKTSSTPVKTPFTVRLEPDALAKLTSIATILRIPVGQLARDAIRSFIEKYIPIEEKEANLKAIGEATGESGSTNPDNPEPINCFERLRRQNVVNNAKEINISRIRDSGETSYVDDPELCTIEDAIDAKYVSGELTSEEWIKQIRTALREYYGKKLFTGAED